MRSPSSLASGIALALALCACKGDGRESGVKGAHAAATERARPAATTASPDQPAEASRVVVYSGRSQPLVGAILEAFEASSGIAVEVKYADTAQLAAALLEEGARSPADVFLAQDASTLALLEDRQVLARLPDAILARVGPSAKSPRGAWVGVTGRARVLAYNTEKLAEADLPKSSAELTRPRWKGRVGWAPENASFQSALSAMIQLEGEDKATAWVAAMQANQPRAYPKNTPAVLAVSRGEVDVALVNHYYLYRLRAEHGDDFPVANHYFRSGKADSLINLSGAAIVASSGRKQAAETLISHLLSDEVQRRFTSENYEFPLVPGVKTPIDLPDVATLNPPVVDLAELSDLAAAHAILRAARALP